MAEASSIPPDWLAVLQWLCDELTGVLRLDEKVNVTGADCSHFVVELSSMLVELGCPYPTLTAQTGSDRFTTGEQRALLFEYLVGELQSARMIEARRCGEQTTSESNKSASVGGA